MNKQNKISALQIDEWLSNVTCTSRAWLSCSKIWLKIQILILCLNG